MVVLFKKERATGLAVVLTPMCTWPRGAEKGRASSQRAGVCRSPFVRIYKVGKKSSLHLSLCQASSSCCYIRYVTSKITKALIGRDKGSLAPQPVRVHQLLCTFQKWEPNSSASLLELKMPTQQRSTVGQSLERCGFFFFLKNF